MTECGPWNDQDCELSEYLLTYPAAHDGRIRAIIDAIGSARDWNTGHTVMSAASRDHAIHFGVFLLAERGHDLF